jgi:molecular chaperone DnaK (HSP70)
MSEVALDFGTCNTVLARHNDNTGQAETIRIPGISFRMEYRLTPAGPEHAAWVVPSMIHYSATETLIGDQVVSRGLAEHPDTIRWMKRGIAYGSSKRKKTSQGFKSPAEAGTDFVTQLFNYASDRVSFQTDSFTLTAPVEAFENFQDWLMRVAESLRIRRVRLLDEPTACVFGYHGAARQDERFVVFDFGGGTLDVSAVRIDLKSAGDIKAIQLGRAGYDIGGMNIDQWLADDFCARHCVDPADRRDLEGLILRKAEAAKIALSSPEQEDTDFDVVNDRTRVPRLLRTTYRRDCPHCRQGRSGRHEAPREGCLGCLLQANNFLATVRETLDRALENAAVKAGMRRSNVTRLLVTGGTSLMPSVRRLLNDTFGSRVDYDHPFDCVARGACRGVVLPILQHDYAVESYSRDHKRYEFKPLFEMGTDYPTAEPKRFWLNGSNEGQTRIGIKVFEVSRLKRRDVVGFAVDEMGVFRQDSQVQTDCCYACLNRENPTFIVADPPISVERDKTPLFLRVHGGRQPPAAGYRHR